MRDGSARRRVTKLQPRTWTPERVRTQHWRQHHRVDVLQELADGARDLQWTRGLVTTLLDELHVTDEFDRLVGPTSRVPASQFPRLIAIALLLRHSWSPYDLFRTGKRIGLGVGPLEAELNTSGCDCSRRRRPLPRLTKRNGA
jgi:hypothetical protein